MSDSHAHTSATAATTPSHGDLSHDGHAHDSHDAAHFHNHAKLYLIIGGVLLVGTGLTVGASYIDFGTAEANIIVAMIIATIKASLVAAIFMHLREEKSTIYQFLIVTAIFATGLFGLTLLAYHDHIKLFGILNNTPHF